MYVKLHLMKSGKTALCSTSCVLWNIPVAAAAVSTREPAVAVGPELPTTMRVTIWQRSLGAFIMAARAKIRMVGAGCRDVVGLPISWQLVIRGEVYDKSNFF